MVTLHITSFVLLYYNLVMSSVSCMYPPLCISQKPTLMLKVVFFGDYEYCEY